MSIDGEMTATIVEILLETKLAAIASLRASRIVCDAPSPW